MFLGIHAVVFLPVVEKQGVALAREDDSGESRMALFLLFNLDLPSGCSYDCDPCSRQVGLLSAQSSQISKSSI